MTHSTQSISIVGVQHHGCASLTSLARNIIEESQVLVGGKRQIAFFPEFDGEKVIIGKKPLDTLRKVKTQFEHDNICLLASGDPLFYGIGEMALKIFSPRPVRVLPSLSSLQLAAAQVGISWVDMKVLSFHARPLERLVARLRDCHRCAILTDRITTPVLIAQYLRDWNENDWDIWVCENLAGVDERITKETVLSLSQKKIDAFSPLNIILMRRANGALVRSASIPFYDDNDYEKRMPKKGLITKKEIRLFILASLRIKKTSIMWDIGAGSGAVGIDASMIAQDGRVFAIEGDEKTLSFLRKNRLAHGADNLHLHEGWAPDALADLPTPDAVFIGGSKGRLSAIITQSFDALSWGGNLVVATITMENTAEAYRVLHKIDASMTMTLMSVSRGRPLAHYTRYEALNPVHVFQVRKNAHVQPKDVIS